jgi:hypothetical protein
VVLPVDALKLNVPVKTCPLTPASEIAARLRTAISVFFMVWSGVVVVFSNPN